MTIKKLKNTASKLLKCGSNKIKINPIYYSFLKSENNRKKIIDLFKKRIIIKKTIKGVSSYRKKLRKAKKQSGLKRGIGRRKGTKNARKKYKILWIHKIRNQRKLLKMFRNKKQFLNYKILLNKIKGNFFSSTKHLLEHMKLSYN
mmetsp:Transcript_25599/g.41067  ORF Transcript_25599/g.41067 Transcript_25599/m.41067 type:complete len:145 (+) Transcript_25599:4626-5060(+)